MIQRQHRMKIFVSNLPKRAANKSFISSFFKGCGRIDPNGITIHENKYHFSKSSGHNFSASVIFDSKEEAIRAKEKYNYTKIDDVPICITFADKETKKKRLSGEGVVYFNNIDLSIDEKQLNNMLSPYGEIIYLKMKRESDKTAAFVQFSEKDVAKQVKKDFNNKEIKDRRLVVYLSRDCARDSMEFTTTCYIQDLPPSINSDDDLKYLFSQYGSVLFSRVVKKRYSGSGIGFATMRTEEEANRAIRNLNRKIIEGQPVYCRHYKSSEERSEFVQKMYKDRKEKDDKEIEGRFFYISNLDNEVTKNDLKFLFGDVGEIESVYKNYSSGGVLFKKMEDGKRFIGLSVFMFLNGKQVRVDTVDKPDYYYFSAPSDVQKNLISILHKRSQDTEKITKCVRNLSDLQAQYLIDNQSFINLWVETCNANFVQQNQ